jgi:predicted small secreted protein
MKKTLLTVMFVMFVAAGSSGCHTISGIAKGAADGMKEDIESVPRMANNGGHAIVKADNWLKENLW